MLNIVILLSGTGSNLAAIVKAIESQQLDARIVGVISDKALAGGLEIARSKNIPSYFIDPKASSTREQFDSIVLEHIKKLKPDVVVLAGFMRILSNDFVSALKGKLLNIHPSLLPKYKGLHTHQRVIENQDREHGCTVHFVNEELDGGAIIAQMAFERSGNENEQQLKEKVHQLEHQLYPMVLQWFAKALVKLEQDTLIVSEELRSNVEPAIRIPALNNG